MELSDRKIRAEIAELEAPLWRKPGFLGPVLAVAIALFADQVLGVSKLLRAEAAAKEAELYASTQLLKLEKSYLEEDIKDFESEKLRLKSIVSNAREDAEFARSRYEAIRSEIEKIREEERLRNDANLLAAEAERVKIEADRKAADQNAKNAKNEAARLVAAATKVKAHEALKRILREEQYYRKRGEMIP